MHKIYKYPESYVKIGIDAGENAIVQFGYDQRSPIDILGYGMNVASKIMSVTGANKVSIGENVYESLEPSLQDEFHELTITDRSKYVNYGKDKHYKIYTLIHTSGLMEYTPHLLNIYDKVRHMTNTARKLVN